MSKPKQNRENPHERVLEQARETAGSLDILKLLDDIPDLPESHVEIPFPYGVHDSKSKGWRQGD